MTPAARVQAAIEVLDLVIASAGSNGPPADRIFSDWFRARRYAGSGDRRAVRELGYRAIRACGERPASGRAAMLRLIELDEALAGLFDGSRHAPAAIGVDEAAAQGGVAPAWLAAALSASGIDGEEADAMLSRAPLDLRVNTLKAARGDVALSVPADATVAPLAFRLPHGTQIESWPVFQDGVIEIQDSASQLVAAAVAARPGETVIDLCAGAGGKTLALAADMENRGRLIACDVVRDRLTALAPRAVRPEPG